MRVHVHAIAVQMSVSRSSSKPVFPRGAYRPQKSRLRLYKIFSHYVTCPQVTLGFHHSSPGVSFGMQRVLLFAGKTFGEGDPPQFSGTPSLTMFRTFP